MKKNIVFVFLILLVQSCTVTFVQPYDEKLVDSTEAFYKDTSLAIEKARAKSPTSRKVNAPATPGINPDLVAQQSLFHADEKVNGSPVSPSVNPGHVSQHELFYAMTKVNANALIIRAMVNSGKVDDIARKAHQEINEVISQAIPTNCDGEKALISGNITLTLQNYLDLKCLVTTWQIQHDNAPNQILKKTNWESRQRSLTSAIIAIQSAETFKAKAKVN